jgi:hypothetical protein
VDIEKCQRKVAEMVFQGTREDVCILNIKKASERQARRTSLQLGEDRIKT